MPTVFQLTQPEMGMAVSQRSVRYTNSCVQAGGVEDAVYALVEEK